MASVAHYNGSCTYYGIDFETLSHRYEGVLNFNTIYYENNRFQQYHHCREAHPCGLLCLVVRGVQGHRPDP